MKSSQRIENRQKKGKPNSSATYRFSECCQFAQVARDEAEERPEQLLDLAVLKRVLLLLDHVFLCRELG